MPFATRGLPFRDIIAADAAEGFGPGDEAGSISRPSKEVPARSGTWYSSPVDRRATHSHAAALANLGRE